MKQRLGLLLLFGILMVPVNVFAKAEDYVSLGLKEACESERINFNHPDYEESKEKANIYLFRGAGCEHCYEFLTYLEAITEKYGKYFNLISYEVWQNENNSILMEKVAKKLNGEVGGVPYIIIGKQSWSGYSESLNEEIFQAIQTEYENKNKNDMVFKIVNFEKKFGVTDIMITISVIALVALFLFARSRTKEVEN